jgi:hypothetical protein
MMAVQGEGITFIMSGFDIRLRLRAQIKLCRSLPQPPILLMHSFRDQPETKLSEGIILPVSVFFNCLLISGSLICPGIEMVGFLTNWSTRIGKMPRFPRSLSYLDTAHNLQHGPCPPAAWQNLGTPYDSRHLQPQHHEYPEAEAGLSSIYHSMSENAVNSPFVCIAHDRIPFAIQLRPIEYSPSCTYRNNKSSETPRLAT